MSTEVEYFESNRLFERTYGWSWFLKLYQELHILSKENNWSQKLKPLRDLLVQRYTEFLPNLVYPIRVGTHTNTAFGLIFPLDYAKYVAESELSELIAHNASNLYIEVWIVYK